MSSQEPKKNVPIYFYYLTISKQKDSDDTSVYDIQQIVEAFSKLLLYTTTKDLTNRKKDITSSEKVVWLDSYEDLKNGNYNIIFKSAKYNHVRNEIDTDLMKMKHYLAVLAEAVTNEVNSSDFFGKAQVFIEEMRNKTWEI